MSEELMEKYEFEADYGDGRGFVRVVPSEGAHAGWTGDLNEWVEDKEGRWKEGGVKALRVRDPKANKILAQNLLSMPGMPATAKLAVGTGEFRPSPPEKAVYSNMMNVGVSQTDLTIDFGRIVVENREKGAINVGVGQVAVIMTYETAQVLYNTLKTILDSRKKGA